MRRLLSAALLTLASPVLAATPDIPALIRATAQELDVPGPVVQAIAKVESGGAPFVLNIEGKGHFFENKTDALAAAQQAQVAGKSFDSGVMQVNNQWLNRYKIPLEAALDPAANIYLGSWILQQEMKRLGSGWSAVARYHSPDPDRGNRYVEMVKQALGKGLQPSKARKPSSGGEPETKGEPEAKDSKKEKKEKPPVETALVVYRGTDRQTFSRQAEDERLELAAFVRRVNK